MSEIHKFIQEIELRIQTIEFNDRIRKSHWSFEIHGDDIKIFPVPSVSASISDLHFDAIDFKSLLSMHRSTVIYHLQSFRSQIKTAPFAI